MTKFSTIALFNRIQSFDWVVLTAALIMLGVSIGAATGPAAANTKTVSFSLSASNSSFD